MKKMLVAALIMSSTVINASEIVLSKSIKPDLRSKIEKDLTLLDSFKFNIMATPQTLEVMGLQSLTSETAKDWLKERVNYIISENAFSTFNLLIKRIIYIDQENVEFPNSDIKPYSMDTAAKDEGFTVMSNIGAALYLGGKEEKQVYGIKISRGLLKKAAKVAVRSPRAGIIQIGEGLFAPELTLNKNNPDALANSIFRLGTFFHEARHSDGNRTSLGFTHIVCPEEHDYAGQPACDENLNGPYTVGALMMTEMARTCDDKCSEADKEQLKLLIIDSESRILTKTHKGEAATNWDATPESL